MTKRTALDSIRAVSRNSSDGYMDEVHPLRDRVGADLVHLVVSDGDDYCGTALELGAFGLTRFGCGALTFTHELGHNLGLWHDRYTQHHREGGVSSHPAYGYVNQRGLASGAAPSRRWRTLMAYNSDSQAYCAKLFRFSNARQAYNGDPLGVPFAVEREWGRRGGRSTSPVGGVAGSSRGQPGAAPSRRWRTLMAYNSDSQAYCAKLFRFSNARQAYNGDPLGVPFGAGGTGVTGPADAAAVLNVTGRIVAAWRDRPGANRPPAAAHTLPDRRLTLRRTLDVDVSQAFVEPDGEELGYTIWSTAPNVVTVRASGTCVALTAVGTGTSTIRVTATDPGGLSAMQSFVVTVTAPFTDDPLRPGETPIKAVHFTELRMRIDALRAAAGLARFTWADAALTAGVTRVRLAHLLELRTALGAAYAASGRTAPRWTDASPTAGATPIRAAHLMELRAAVMALER